MSPNSGENKPNLELPRETPQEEGLSEASVEKAPVKSPENSPQSQTASSSAQAASSIAVPSQTVAQTFSDNTSVPVADDSSTAQSATDSDRIDKQWVDRAKAVLVSTKDDPFEQKNQMSKVKAEYIKSRFNKTIRTDDTVAR